MSPIQIWFVDDREDNLQTWRDSFPEAVKKECCLRCFSSIGSVEQALSEGFNPDILFLDFFVGDRYGFELVRQFPPDMPKRPVLIAHSSMELANTGLVNNGADFAMEKIKEVPVTDSIVSRIQSMEDIQFILTHKKLPARAF